MTRLCAPYTSRGRGMRLILWRVVSSTVFKLIPSPAYTIRRAVLVAFGAQLDSTSRIRGGVRISEPWNLRMGRKSSIGEGATIWSHAPLTIGSRTVISQYCFVQCAAREVDQEYPKPIEIGDDVWIAAESVIVGGTKVPNGVLVGARSVVRDAIESWTIATGHPAKTRRERPYQGPKS